MGPFGLCEYKAKNVQLNDYVNDKLTATDVRASCSSLAIDPSMGRGYIGVYSKTVLEIPIPNAPVLAAVVLWLLIFGLCSFKMIPIYSRPCADARPD